MAGKRSRRVLVAIVATLALPSAGRPRLRSPTRSRSPRERTLLSRRRRTAPWSWTSRGRSGGSPPRAAPPPDSLGDEAEPSLPVVTPDGRRVIYQDYSDGNFHIWSMAADGSDRQRLTDGPFDDREPAVSPDGRSVAFSSDRSGTYGIWVLDIATGEVRPWADTPDQDSQPTWSPDGREIAWVVGKAPDDPDRQIGLLVTLTSRTIEASDGTAAPRTLATESSGTIVAPSWGAGGVARVLLGTNAST